MHIQKELDFLKENSNLFLDYLVERYPVHLNSNIFLRDIQYGIESFFEKRNIKLKKKDTYVLTDFITNVFESTNKFMRLNNNTWKVNSLIENNVIKENPNNA